MSRGSCPAHLPVSEINTGTWQVPPVPDDLLKPGIEISGPASITHMFINALNPGPEGTRAEGDLDDDEDSARHSLSDTVKATWNRLEAVRRTLTFSDPGAWPDLSHRRRRTAIFHASGAWHPP